MKKHTLMATLFVAVFALIGCTAVTNTGSNNDANASIPTAASSSNEDADADIPTDLELQVMRARQHLAATLSIDLSGVTVVETTPIEWNDSSLGCPEPDMMYLMVITPGYHIVLEANGEQYEYHADENETVVLCPEDRSVLKGEEKPSAEVPEGAASLVEQARRDLTAKLGISFNNVLVTQVTAVEWNDSSLGCPQPNTMYMDVITPGYLIVLEANGLKYNYHTDENDYLILCSVENGSFAPSSEALIAEVKRDLANKLGVSMNSIVFIEVTAVEWRDSSLGCPEPDMAYLTVITPGYQIVLDVDGVKYNYHTNKDGYFVLCPDDRSEAGSAIEQ